MVWLCSEDPMLCLGFEQVLGSKADLHCGEELPAGREFSCAICPYGTDVGLSLKRLRSLAPEVPVLIYGLNVDPDLFRIGVWGGVSGYIHAGMEVGQIVQTISLVSEGKVMMSEELLRKLDRVSG